MEGGSKRDAEASSSTISKRQGPSDERGSGSSLPDSPEEINVLSESEANSGPSASYADVIGNNYYVFLSFRGLDTRKGFVDHLYHELVRAGLHHPNFVFRDDESLDFGEPIAETILSAIKHSKVSIPVISKNFAASKWCLREIIQIMECVESGQQKVYPVLYNVTTDYVKDMEGKFGEAFRDPENGFDEKLKQEGLVALRKALDRKVFELEKFANGYEGKFVKAVVEKIMREQQHDFPPSLPVDLVGIDDHVAKVMKLANTTSSETQIIVIYGIGGIGKTTLAKAIYEKLSDKFDKFDCRSFLKDIRETIKSKGMKHVQYLHISNLTKNSDHNVHDYGIEMIQAICKNKKVLIFLDDVDRRDHLDNLFGDCDFKSGSWIIITCRDEALFKSEYKGYKLERMNLKNSLLLFCRYAFKREKPPIEFMALSSDIVVATGGLPLCLVIIGSFLKRKEQSIWTETLEKLKRAPPMDVQQKLRISYDSLEYEEQQMFLDIACFFIGINKRFAAYLWEDLQYYLESRLERMIELSLMKIDDNNEFRMHDQLRDLGRAIACPAQKKPRKCSRLWDEKAIIVQRSKKENSNIEALRLDENGSSMFWNRRSFKRMPYLKFLHMSKVGSVGNFEDSLPELNFEDSLSELRWLEWEECPNSFRVTNLHLEKLLILDLSYGYISYEWRGWSLIKMERLKVLNLFRCIELKTTPNLSACKSLEMLILESCHNLVEICPSIGDVKCLTFLNLSNCHKLERLPSQLGKLRGLISLNLDSCKKLLELPKEMGELENLKELTIAYLKIKKIPRSIGFLKKLETLDAQGCASLVGLPNSFRHLANLSTLNLRSCCTFKGFPKIVGSLVKLQRLLLCNTLLSYDKDSENPQSDKHCHKIPRSIGKLESLTELELRFAFISKLPKSIGELKNLKILDIAGCGELKSLPTTISKLSKLEELNATCCEKLEGRVSINRLSSLKILRLGKLGKAADFWLRSKVDETSRNRFSDLYSQHHLYLTICNLPANLTCLEVNCYNRTLPQLSHLIHLEELSFQSCKNLQSIPVLPSKILNLWIFCCGQLKRLPSLSSLKLLSELHIIECNELTKIKGLEGLESLGELSIWGCKKLSNLNGLEHLESLRRLEIIDVSLMNKNVQCFGRLKNLEYLHIYSCRFLKRLDISQLTHLKILKVEDCKHIVEIKSLQRLEKLTTLDIRECDSIRKLPDLSLLGNLKLLIMRGCWELHDVQGLEEVELVRPPSNMRARYQWDSEVSRMMGISISD